MSQRPYLPCREILEFLADYVEGALPAETRFEFERHLAVCPSCVAYIDSYRKTTHLARGAMSRPALDVSDAPPELVSAILASLARTQ